jgi:DnaJ homolog subfamily A member 2
MTKHTELYDLLEISPTASDDDIKKAYKKLAIKYHPDKNKDSNATEMFQKISNAFQILSDPDKRRRYDQFGLDAVNNNNSGGVNPHDILSQMFGGAFNMGQQQKKAMRINHQLDFNGLFTESEFTINYQRDCKCNSCEGTGYTDKISRKCKKCNGAKVITNVQQMGMHIIQQTMPCNVCNGTGKSKATDSNDKCIKCNDGISKESFNYKIKLPINFITNPQIVLSGKGPYVDGSYIDLVIVLSLPLPDKWSINNNKLVYTLDVPLEDLLTGVKQVFNHPSGKKLVFNILGKDNNILDPTKIYNLSRYGPYENGELTNMYLKINVVYPKKIIYDTTKSFSKQSLYEGFTQKELPKITLTNIEKIDLHNLNTVYTEQEESQNDKQPECRQQ